MAIFINILISLVFAAMRIYGIKHEAFQAAVHLYVGWLIRAWWWEGEKYASWLVLILSVLEVICAVLTVLGKL